MTLKETFIVWFKAARAPFLVISIIPAVLAGLIARSHGPIDWTLFVLVAVGVVMAHSAGDFVDDYFDFKKGNLGNKEKQFHDSPLIDGKVTPRQVLAAALACVAIALATGVYALLKVGMPVIYLTGIGVVAVFFYTSPPLMLNYRGLGETVLFVAFGPLIVWGIYYVLNQTFNWAPVLASIPLGVFTMNVGVVSNTFDHDDDVKSGKRTFPVRFGQTAAVRLIIVGSLLSYIALIIGVIFHLMTPWTLIAFLGLPLAFAVVKKTSLFTDLSNYTEAMTKAIALSSVTGLLLCLAYGIAIFTA
jgi:1,4-dihydroxy-2-naphthoate octaprenyltransferase